MDSYEENYLSQRPQSLCKMCGQCCRFATVPQTYEELKQLAKEGNQGAIDFLKLFVPYESTEEARKLAPDIVKNVINLHKADGKYNENKLRFYHCRFINDNNLCENYENRPLLCKHFPSTPWAIVPPNCGFSGWLFWRREEIKQKVRKEKEELIELRLLKNKTSDKITLDKIELVEQKLQRNIDLYKKYGSDNW